MADPAARRDIEVIQADGFVVIEGLLSAAELRACRDALAPQLESELFGRNQFEGLRTQRVYPYSRRAVNSATMPTR